MRMWTLECIFGATLEKSQTIKQLLPQRLPARNIRVKVLQCARQSHLQMMNANADLCAVHLVTSLFKSEQLSKAFFVECFIETVCIHYPG